MRTIFIRYNPDEYNINGKKKDVVFSKRMSKLNQWIDHIKSDEFNMEKNLGVLYLYFNEYNKSDDILYIM